MHVFHSWSKWSEPYICVEWQDGWIVVHKVDVWYQKRDCAKCGNIQTKQISSKGLASDS